MLGPMDVSRELLAAEIPHEFVRLPRRIATADELPDVLDVPPRECVVVRIYETDRGRRALLLPTGAMPVPARLARATGARVVGMAGATATSLCTDFTATLVAPVCLPRDLPVVADAALGASDVLYAATGDGGTALKIRAVDLLRHTGARVDTLTKPALAPLFLEETVPHTGVAAVR